MISKKHRFRGHNSLNYVYRKGSTLRAPYCAMRAVKTDRTDGYRLAVVVSKKVAKLAVTRNRIRRRVFEAFRVQIGEGDFPYDMILTVFAAQLKEIPSEELNNIIGTLIKQISKS